MDAALTPEARELFERANYAHVATLMPDGSPQVVAVWAGLEGERIVFFTQAGSQKARNLERDPRVTLQVETGVEYQELRGIMLRCEARLHRDPAVLEDIALALTERYTAGGPDVLEAARAAFQAQIPKRVGLEFVETGHRVTWDHRKLAGVY